MYPQVDTKPDHAAPLLDYAEPSWLEPLPAMRRIRAMAITWSALAILYEITNLVTTLFWPEGGGWSVYLEYPVWVHANALGAILLASAVLVWRKIDPPRMSWPAFVLTSITVLMLLVVSIGRIASFHFTRTWLDGVAFASEFARFGAFAAVPLAVVWAAIQPQKFTAVRLAGVAAFAMLFGVLFTGVSIAGLATTISPWSSSFWNTLLSRGWIVIVVQTACVLAAAVLFGLATRELRRRRSAVTAVVASWLILAMIGWECLFVYGLWWDAVELAGWMHAVRIVGNGVYLLWLLSAALVFVLPLKRATEGEIPESHRQRL